MIIGIPRAFLYYRYYTLWHAFFTALGQQVVVSRESDKGILSTGAIYAIDEACLSSKVYLGHVESLIGHCDMIFVPRISNFGVNQMLCTKFEALHDIVMNTFRHQKIKLLDCDIDVRNGHSELSAFIDLGKKLGKGKAQSTVAYLQAKQAERKELDRQLQGQNSLFQKDGIKILVVGHCYNLHDRAIGLPVIEYLENIGVIPILADTADRKQAMEKATQLSDTLPWVFNRELVGAVAMYKDKVDGLILLSAFPCGPDSLVNEIILRRVKDKPILNLLLDSQDGTAGIETRLESFIDIIRFRQEKEHEQA